MVEEVSQDRASHDLDSAEVPPAPPLSDGEHDDDLVLHDIPAEKSTDLDPPPPPSISEPDSITVSASMTVSASVTPEQKNSHSMNKNGVVSVPKAFGLGTREDDLVAPLAKSAPARPVITCDVDETTKEILGKGSESESEEMVRLFGDEDSRDPSLDNYLVGGQSPDPANPAASSPPAPSKPADGKGRAPAKAKREWARVGITPWRRPRYVRKCFLNVESFCY